MSLSFNFWGCLLFAEAGERVGVYRGKRDEAAESVRLSCETCAVIFTRLVVCSLALHLDLALNK